MGSWWRVREARGKLRAGRWRARAGCGVGGGWAGAGLAAREQGGVLPAGLGNGVKRCRNGRLWGGARFRGAGVFVWGT